MGCSQSVPPSKFDKIKIQKVYSAGDQRNLSLLRHAIHNNTDLIKLSLEYTDLCSPWNNVPLIYSVIGALLNDPNFARFKKNFNLIKFDFAASLPPTPFVNILLSNFIANKNHPRSTCVPVLHIRELNELIISDFSRYQLIYDFGKLTNCSVRDYLLFIINNISSALKKMTVPVASTTEWTDFTKTATCKMIKIIVRNSKYAISEIDSYKTYPNENSPPSYDTYYSKYNKDYMLEKEFVDPYTATYTKYPQSAIV
jgi:hypothetical protein